MANKFAGVNSDRGFPRLAPQLGVEVIKKV